MESFGAVMLGYLTTSRTRKEPTLVGQCKPHCRRHLFQNSWSAAATAALTLRTRMSKSVFRKLRLRACSTLESVDCRLVSYPRLRAKGRTGRSKGLRESLGLASACRHRQPSLFDPEPPTCRSDVEVRVKHAERLT